MTDRPQQGEQPTPYRDADGRPRYGMLLPEGRDISEFIVPPRPPAGADRVAGGPGRRPGAGGAHDAPGPRGPATPRPWAGADPYATDPYATGPAGAAPRPAAGHPGDPHDPRGGPAEQHRLRRRRRAVAAVLVGLALLVVGPVTGAAYGVLRGVEGVGEVLDSGIRTTDGGAATLPEGVERQVYRTDGQALASCVVTDPEGAELPTTVVAAAGAREPVLTVPGILFTTRAAGSYSIDCADVPTGTDLLVSPPLRVDDPGTAMRWVFGGLVAGALGLGVAIWGVLVLRFTRTPAWYRR